MQGSAEYGLRVAALLHGPDGSGRATAAMAAAAALGIHLVAYSCLELKVRLAMRLLPCTYCTKSRKKGCHPACSAGPLHCCFCSRHEKIPCHIAQGDNAGVKRLLLLMRALHEAARWYSGPIDAVVPQLSIPRQGSRASDTVKGLEAAVEQASEYRPVILLLRHLESLCTTR